MSEMAVSCACMIREEEVAEGVVDMGRRVMAGVATDTRFAVLALRKSFTARLYSGRSVVVSLSEL